MRSPCSLTRRATVALYLALRRSAIRSGVMDGPGACIGRGRYTHPVYRATAIPGRAVSSEEESGMEHGPAPRGPRARIQTDQTRRSFRMKNLLLSVLIRALGPRGAAPRSLSSFLGGGLEDADARGDVGGRLV